MEKSRRVAGQLNVGKSPFKEMPKDYVKSISKSREKQRLYKETSQELHPYRPPMLKVQKPVVPVKTRPQVDERFYDDEVQAKLALLMNKLKSKEDIEEAKPAKVERPGSSYISPYAKEAMKAPKKVDLASKHDTFPELYLRMPAEKLKASQSHKIKWFKPDSKFKKTELKLKIGTVLGKGSFATVYEAVDESLENRVVAVKIFDKRLLRDASKRKEVQEELDLLAKLDHPNIIKLLRVVEDSNLLYIVTENWGKTTLDEICLLGPPPKRIVRDIFGLLAHAIGYLHDHNVFHRDVKLSNIMVRGKDICLLDFGLAASSSYVKEFLYCGTPTYMAPEMLDKRGYEGGPIDVWCFGVCLYRVLTGKYPFGGRI